MNGKRIDQLSSVTQEFAMQQIIREGDNLRNFYHNCKERVIKSLFFLSSGGIVTILANINRDKSLFEQEFWFIALVSFLIGLIAVFILAICDYYYMRTQLCYFSDDVIEFQNNKITFNEIRHFSNDKKQFIFLTILFLFSILSTSSGITNGILGYLSPHKSAEYIVSKNSSLVL